MLLKQILLVVTFLTRHITTCENKCRFEQSTYNQKTDDQQGHNCLHCGNVFIHPRNVIDFTLG